MRQRAPVRWGTTFGQWARAYGPARIVADLSRLTGHSVTPATVYHWIAGRHTPRHELAITISRISSGAVSIDDIHRHRDLVRAKPTRRGEGDPS